MMVLAISRFIDLLKVINVSTFAAKEKSGEIQSAMNAKCFDTSVGL